MEEARRVVPTHYELLKKTSFKFPFNYLLNTSEIPFFCLPLYIDKIERYNMTDKTPTEGTHKNPFFLPYDTPHDTVPFDRIRLEDYEEAMMEGIRREDEQIEKIVNNPEEPTFENTIIPEDDVQGRKHYLRFVESCGGCFSLIC